MELTLTLSKRDALMLVTALGVLKDRVGQKARWFQRKRLPRLRQQLADCVIIGDENMGGVIRKNLEGVQREVDRRIAFGEEIATKMNELKALAGITDEHIRFHTDDDHEL